MKLTPHLVFNGQCREAFTFYERLLGGKMVAMVSHAETPMAAEVAPEWRDKIVHATLALGEQQLAGADVLPAQYEKPRGVYVLVSVANCAEAERIFAAFCDGGEVQMPGQKTFWSPFFGVVVDRFGTPWEVTCDA